MFICFGANIVESHIMYLAEYEYTMIMIAGDEYGVLQGGRLLEFVLLEQRF
jgi:hypothetical protein